MQAIINKNLFLNIVSIKIISLLIGFSSIGACLKIASVERFDRKPIRSNEIIQKRNQTNSDSLTTKNMEAIENKFSVKNYFIDQNIIVY
jgi:hypothetical protein